MRVSKEQREALRRKAGDCAAYWPGPWGRTEGSRVIDATGVLIAVVHGWPEAAPYITAADPETIAALLDDLNDAEQRAERAEAELAALRERVRELACSENAQVVLFGVTGTHPEAYGGVTKDEALECAEAVLTDMRHLLDDDTTGAASDEGEK